MATPSSSSRKYDVVVYGATGFTGRLVSVHLSNHKDSPRWAIAGRSHKRLEDVRQSLKLLDQIGIIVADNNDHDSIAAMAQQTRCIINLVGPYRQFGADKIIAACVQQKTHYVDLNGETSFTQEVIAKFHDQARQAGVVIACSSGYDSVPSDLTSYLAVQHFKANHDDPVTSVHVSTRAAPIPLEVNGAFSTGTLLSLIDMADEDPDQISFTQPGRLSPLTPPLSRMPFTFAAPESHFGRGKYGCSWILGPHNIRIVYRSWGLLEQAQTKDAYGDKFTYTETLHSGSYPFSMGTGFFFYLFHLLITHVALFRTFLKKTLPPNGGPSEKAQAKMKVDVRAIASSASSTKTSSLCALHARGHPGYSVTAVLISEMALTLALEDPKNLHVLAQKGGVLTPATIGAERIAERLKRNADFEISCTDFSS